MCTIHVAPPTILRSDWETLARHASSWIKLLDFDACLTSSLSSCDFVVQPINRSPFNFDAQTNKPSRWFWCPNHQDITIDFEAQTEKLSTNGFKIKPAEIVTTNFKVKLKKIVPVILSSSHWQTVDLAFETQPENLRSSSSRGRYRLHTSSPDLPIVWPPSNWHVRPSLVLCTKSPTPVTILIAGRHAAAATCTSQDKQPRLSTQIR
jgi:hypothetical protein